MWEVLSVYTVGTPYEDIVKKLETSLQKLSIPHQLIGVEPLGTWKLNAAYRANIFLEYLEKYNRDFVGIDADAIVQQYPSLFDEYAERNDFDLAIHLNSRDEYLAGTMYMKPTKTMKNVLRRWIQYTKTMNPPVLSQINLKKAIRDYPIKLIQLPPTYVQIFDIMKNAGRPVIEHFQASRKFKSLVNKG